jgi:hypothetical protein
VSGLHPDALALAAAALEAIGIPSPATVGDDEIRVPILLERVQYLHLALRNLLGANPRLGWELDYLRQRLAEHPAEGYRTWDEVTAGRLGTSADEDGK